MQYIDMIEIFFLATRGFSHLALTQWAIIIFFGLYFPVN